MKRPVSKCMVVFLTCSLLFRFTVPAMAWPPPCTEPCEHWDGWNCMYECDVVCEECVGDVCQDTCTGCRSCVGSTCIDDDNKCTGECHNGCSGGSCTDDQSKCTGECHTCSGGSCTDDQSKCTGECHTCSDGSCEDDDSKCDPDKCETCVDGSCQVCGGDPTKVCCDGTCCDKVWTKETITGFDQSCPACSDYYWGCVGTPKTLSSYEQCLNVGVGLGEHCQCNDTMQVVGYIYHCKANWDVAKLLWCAAQGVWCVVECAISGFDPSTCANCLAGIDCGDGFMEICDFVESCDPYDPSELKDLVFTGFDC